jgi:hypothetical protein
VAIGAGRLVEAQPQSSGVASYVQMIDGVAPAAALDVNTISMVMLIAALPAMLVESLPGKIRCSALAFSYNVVVGLCGGFTPMVVTWLVHRTGVDMVPAMIIMLVAALILLGLWRQPETAGQPLR